MNKKIIIAAIIVILILFVSAGLYLSTKSKPIAQTPEASSQTAQPKQSVFGSIADALSKSLSLSCDFSDEQGRHIVSNIKNGAVRADITAQTAQESGSMIMKDKKIYFWNAQKQGFMMTLPDVTGAPVPTGSENKGQATQQDMMNTMEKYKQYCKPAVVADSVFTPPSDVTFTDYSKMMVPPTNTGATGSSGTNPQPSMDYQKYIQQYKQQYQQ